MMVEPEIHYCPECGWNTWVVFFPGNNGLVPYDCCTFCGWYGKSEE